MKNLLILILQFFASVDERHLKNGYENDYWNSSNQKKSVVFQAVMATDLLRKWELFEIVR